MALRLMDGFNNYSTTNDMYRVWDALPIGPNLVTGRRAGTKAFQSTYFGNVYLLKVLDAQPTFIFGNAVNYAYSQSFNQAGSIVEFKTSAGEQISLRRNASQQLYVSRNGTTLWDSGTDVRYKIYNNTWLYIEFKATIDPTAGSWSLRINGSDTTLVSQTGVNTAGQGGTTADRVNMNVGLDETRTDLYICDGTGTVCKDFLGDCRIDPIIPSADGTHSDFSKSSGATSYNLLTSNDGDTSYINGGTVSNITTVNVNDLPYTPASIYGMSMMNYSRKNDSGSRGVKNVIRTNGADYLAANETALSTSYVGTSNMWALNPATGNPFTLAEINALELGVQVSS